MIGDDGGVTGHGVTMRRMEKGKQVADDVLKALCQADGGTMTVHELTKQLNLSGVGVRNAIKQLRNDPCGSLVGHDPDFVKLDAEVWITEDGKMECRSRFPDCADGNGG